jgi:hypothetical protein
VERGDVLRLVTVRFAPGASTAAGARTHFLFAAFPSLCSAKWGFPPSRLPSEQLQINPLPGVKSHSFTLEHHALRHFRPAARSQADLPARVDDPVPWHKALPGKNVECVADLPGVSSKAC